MKKVMFLIACFCYLSSLGAIAGVSCDYYDLELEKTQFTDANTMMWTLAVLTQNTGNVNCQAKSRVISAVTYKPAPNVVPANPDSLGQVRVLVKSQCDNLANAMVLQWERYGLKVISANLNASDCKWADPQIEFFMN